MRIKKNNGFTIIEVALVLAIAGLIFLMIFVALPSLQRLQRDTARREDITSLIATIKKFQSNNRGALPTGSGTISTSATSTSNKTSWADFYIDYMHNGNVSDSNEFTDPSGEKYKLSIQDCGTKVASGDECTNTAVTNVSKAEFPNDFTLTIVLQASCDGIKAVGSSNPRKLAILYVLEGSGEYCLNS